MHTVHFIMHTARHIQQKTRVTVSNRLLAVARELVQILSNTLASDAFFSSSNCTKIRWGAYDAPPDLQFGWGKGHPFPRPLPSAPLAPHLPTSSHGSTRDPQLFLINSNTGHLLVGLCFDCRLSVCLSVCLLSFLRYYHFGLLPTI